MDTKSDFAQKLLHDLRLRKERMAAASQHSSSVSSSSSSSTRGSNGSPGPAYKGYEQTKTYESVGLKSVNSSTKPNGRSKSFQFEDTSNHQLVPYMNGQSSSTAMELAFPNGGNLKKTDPKGRNPMLNFLQEIGKRSLGKGNIEIKSSFGKNSSSDSHVITFSQVHVSEISKGIQKLNQILKNCSKGINLERYSTDVGKELLKGAIDLEQSIRMLANSNEGSARGKNKIKLLEDNEENDDGNKNARLNDLNQVERPRFSFDKPNKNALKTKQGGKNIIKQQPEETRLQEKQHQSISKSVIHSRSVSMDLDAEYERISSRLQPKNPKTSNVIAKLMGLDDIPQKDDSKEIKSRRIETMASKREIAFHEPQYTSSIPPFTKSKDALRSKTANPDSIFTMKAEKIMSPYRGSSTGLIAENDTSAGSVTRIPANTVDKEEEIKIIRIDDDRGNKQETGKEHNDEEEEKEKNTIMTGKTEYPLLQMHDKVPIELGASKAKHVSESKHEKHLDFYNLKQQKKVRKLHDIEEKRKVQHPKQKPLTREPKGSQQGCKTSLRDSDKRQASKKLDIADTKTLVKPLEANRPKIMFNKRQGLDSTTGETDEMKILKRQMHIKTDAAVDENKIVLKPEAHSIVYEPMEQENAKKSRISGLGILEPMEQQIDKETKISGLAFSKPMEQQNDTSTRISGSAISEQMEQWSDKKTRISGLAKQESDPLITEAVCSQSSKPEMSSQTLKLTELSHKVAEDITYYNHSEEKDQSTVYSKPPTANANIINIAEEAPEVTNDFQSSQQTSLCADDIEMEPLKTSLPQHKGDHEIKAVAIHVAKNKHTIKSPSWYTDQLTESENQLKGILIKNQLFLHTAEALFKLNIPVIMLHGADHNDNLADNKLISDCGIELLKKKGKRRQLSCPPFKSLDCAIMFKSFDGLIQQLNKDLCMQKSYGGEWDDEYDPSENIYQMLEKDVHYKDPDVNSMWDFGWYENAVASSEKNEVIKEVEKHMLRKLLDELTRDLLDTATQNNTSMSFQLHT